MSVKNISFSITIILLFFLNTIAKINATPLRRVFGSLTTQNKSLSKASIRTHIKTQIIIPKQKTSLELFEELLELEQLVIPGKPVCSNEFEHTIALEKASAAREKFNAIKMTEDDANAQIYTKLLYDYCNALSTAENFVVGRIYQNTEKKQNEYFHFINRVNVSKNNIELQEFLSHENKKKQSQKLGN